MLRLQRVAPPEPPPPVALAAPPTAAATVDGHLLLLGEPPCGPSSSACFVLTLQREGQPPAVLAEPLGALCQLPAGGADGGLLFAQLGSCRLLFAQPSPALELGQSADVFFLGSHEAPIAAITASPCGNQALSVDEQGGLALWSLADGTQLAAVSPGSSGSSGSGAAEPAGSEAPAPAAACFLPDGTAATALASGSVVRLWSTPFLRLQAELDAGGGSSSSSRPCRRVVALAASGGLLAVGCSDGSTQLWRRTGLGEFAQLGLLPPSEQGGGAAAGEGGAAAVSCLAFSADASLLAAAAGNAITLCCAPSGQVLGQQRLGAAPVALHWGAGGKLSTLLAGGSWQRLGAPEAPPAAAAEPCQPHLLPDMDQAALQRRLTAASTTAPAAPGSSDCSTQQQLPSPRKKAVRFAEPAASAGAAQLSSVRISSLRLPAPDAAAGRASSNLPPLPSHPLLRGYAAGGSWASRPPFSSTHSSSGSLPGSAPASSSQRAPLYPILDLRALRGLQPLASAPAGAAAAPLCKGAAACSPPARSSLSGPTAEPAAVARQAGTAPAASGVAATRSELQAGTAPEAWQPPMSGQKAQSLPASCSPAQAEAPVAAAPAPSSAAADGDEEAPRPARLPAPTQRQRSPSPAPRVSKQRCDACKVLAGAQQPAAGGSQPGSPNGPKTAEPAQLSALHQGAAAPGPGASAALPSASQPFTITAFDGGRASGSRPSSPLKPGAARVQAEQEAAMQPQTAAVRPPPGPDASLGCSEPWRQRYARLSRRCTLAAATQPAGAGGACSPAAAKLPRAGEQLPQLPHASCSSSKPQSGSGPSSAAQAPSPVQPPVGHGAPAAPADELLQAGCCDGAPLPAATLAGAAAELEALEAVAPAAPAGAGDEGEAEPLPEPAWGGSFAVASDDELGDGEDEVLTAPAELVGAGAAGAADAARWQAPPPCLSAAVDVRPKPAAAVPPPAARWTAPTVQPPPLPHMLLQLGSGHSGLTSRALLQPEVPVARAPPVPVPAPTPHAAALPAPWPAAAGPHLQPGAQAAAPAAAPPEAAHAPHAPGFACTPGCPEANSSLLPVHRKDEQACGAAPVPLTSEQLAAARRRAATAATTVPPGARLYSALPPAEPAGPSGGRLSPSKVAALAGARKHLDARWVAEQQELQPELCQLWVAAERLPGPPPPGALPSPLPVQLPEPRRLAAEFLGLIF